MRHLSHKIRIYPNDKTVSYFVMCFGVARFAYNWALAQCVQEHEEGKKCPSGYDLSKRLNAIKRLQFPWMYDVSKWVSQKSVYDLANSFQRFFKKTSKFPKFKKKNRCRDSFYAGIGCFKVDKNRIRLPNIGWIRMSQEVRFPGRLLSAVVSRESDRFFVSIQVELDDNWRYSHICKNQASVGIDLGIRDLAVLSTGEKLEGPKSLRRNEYKLIKAQRNLSRKKKGSRNGLKAKNLLNRIHAKIRDTRLDCIHKLTSVIVEKFRFVGIEDLNVSGMLKNRKLSKSISDSGWYELRRQLGYKANFSGSVVQAVDRFFPSSKTCSICSFVLESLGQGATSWLCPSCSSIHDRDINAAINIKTEAARRYREVINACGGVVRPVSREAQGQTLLKQEGGF